MNNRKFPIGVQNFEKIRKGDFLYVDKTELIYQLVDSGSYYFLSRPRRLVRVCLFLRSKPIFWERKNFSTDWTWSS